MSERTPFWLDGHAPPASPALEDELECDVAIVGGGMAGLHCALNLRSSGLRVAVFEARRIGEQATGKSTAKITSQHGLRYRELQKSFGEENARIYAEANQKAVEDICDLCAELDSSPALQRRDAFVYARNGKEAENLRAEAEAASKLGLPASFVQEAAVPFPVEGLLQFSNQAQFDPAAYLRGLAGLISSQAQIFEQSRVTSVDDGDPYRLTVNGHRVAARYVVIATQMPIVDDGMFFAKAFPFAHPVAAAPLPENVAVEGMFISAGSPSHSFRTTDREDRTYLIAVGSEYKPGQPSAQAEATDELLKFLQEHFRVEQPTHLWTSEDFRPMDGAAFVGRATPSKPNLLVATGFQAWGITQGAVAGEILAAAIMGESHPAASLFDATRVKPLSGGARFVSENTKAGAHLVGDRLLGGKARKLEDIGPHGGGVISHGGEKLAVRPAPDGGFMALSAVCTHMGCVVDWNAADRTWDCPCHGSRFDEDGTVLAGPAVAPLPARDKVSSQGDET